MTTPLLTVNKFPVLTRSNFTQESSVTFPVGGTDDQIPIINLALTAQTAAERIVQYLDIGQTDAVKDLDIITTTTMIPLYLDPSYVESSGSAMLSYLPPKCVMVRCLAGSGLLYVNPPSPLDDSVMLKVVPFTLHANMGLFSYAFPRGNTHAAVATDPTDPTKKLPYPLALVSMYLRTFEEYNRFQVVIFK